MKKYIVGLLVLFFASYFLSDILRAKASLASSLNLPEPNQLLHVSKERSMPVLTGIKLDPSNPANIEFYIDSRDISEISNDEAQTIINYFFAGLTVKDENLWVNLSPYESDRVMDDALSVTELGKGLLEQDYILKQLAASLTYPDTELGDEFWQQEIPELNKIWISPDKAEIYVEDDYVFVADASLKVESETKGSASDILLPKITEQVNHGQHFSKLRQIYYSLILAKWFKQNFFESFYANYINHNRISGLDLVDAQLKDKVYQLYCDAFKNGAYKFIKKEESTNRTVKRKYFSGGVVVSDIQTMASSIKSIEELPLVGKIFSVNGAVKYRTAKHITKAVWLNFLTIFSTFAQDLDIIEELAELSLEDQSIKNEQKVQASVANWTPLGNFLLAKFPHPHQQRLLKAMIDHVIKAKVPLVLVKDYDEWSKLTHNNGSRAFVMNETVYIFLDFARPNVVFHELIHVFQSKEAQEFYKISRQHSSADDYFLHKISQLPMFADFNLISNMIYSSDDTVLIDLFTSMHDNLNYDYNNPLKNVWYNHRAGTYSLDSAVSLVKAHTNGAYDKKFSLKLLEASEYEVNQITENYSRVVDEFFAFVYGAAIAHDLGFGQESLTEEVQDKEAAALSKNKFYRTINIEAIAAKLLYRLKQHPRIMANLARYYRDRKGFPLTNAFNIDSTKQDFYALGVGDDILANAQLADYYEFVGNDSKALNFYFKQLRLVAKAEWETAYKANEMKTISLAIANLYAKHNNKAKLNEILSKVETLAKKAYTQWPAEQVAANMIFDDLWIASLNLKVGQRELAHVKLENANKAYQKYKRNFDRSLAISLQGGFIDAYSEFGNNEQVASFRKEIKRSIANVGDVPGQRDMADRLARIADLLAKTKDYSGAHKIHERSLDFYPDTARVKNEILNMYLENKRYVEAADYIEKDLDELSRPQLYHTLADIYHYELRESQKAVEVLEECYERFPSDIRTRKLLMDIYMLTGQRSKIKELQFMKNDFFDSDVYAEIEQEINGGIDLDEIKIRTNAMKMSKSLKLNKKMSILSLKYEIENIEMLDLAAL